MNVEHGEKKDQVGTGQRKAACLMFGYICEHFLMTRAELDAMKYRIDDLAREKGYAMGGVYVERAASAPAAFRALILAVTRHDASVIGVPSLLHLAGLGASPTDTRDYIEQCIATRVLIANTKTAAKTEYHGGGQDDESGPTTPPQTGRAGVLVPAPAPVLPIHKTIHQDFAASATARLCQPPHAGRCRSQSQRPESGTLALLTRRPGPAAGALT